MPLTHRRRLAAAGAAVLAAVAAGLAGAQPALAGAAPAAYTPAYHGVLRGQPFHVLSALVTVHDGPLRDHPVTLDTDLYVPAGATAAHPAPLLLQTNGFGLSKTAAEITTAASYFAGHGYVVQTWSAQGFGHSGGCVALDSRDADVADASALITRDAALPYIARDARGPIVGIYGGSYGGGLDAILAETDPRVRAVIPGRTWNSLQYALDPNNLVVPGDATGFSHQLAPQGVFKQQWTSLFYALGNAQPAMGNGGCLADKQAAAAAQPTSSAALADLAGAAACPGYHLPLCQTFAGITASGDASASSVGLLAAASAATLIGQLRVPTLLVQGESDTLFNENDAAATYTALRRAGTPVAWIWNSGGHGGYDSLPGECEVYGGGTTNLEGCYLTSRELAWFDRWLRRAAVDTGPGFSYYRDWTPPAAGTTNAAASYGNAAAFPAVTPTVVHLSGSAALVAAGTPVTPGSVTLVNPPGGTPASYTETSNFSGPASSPNLALPPTDPAGEVAAFTTPPLRQDTVLVGIPTVTLHATHLNGQDLVLFGRLVDVAPDGTTTLVHRLIAPVRVPAALAAGGHFTFHLLGTAHLFRAGHAIRLSLASTDATSYNARVADTITVLADGSSTVALPLAAAAPGTTTQTAPGVTFVTAPTRPAVLATRQGSLATTGLDGAGLGAAGLLLLAAGALVRGRARRA